MSLGCEETSKSNADTSCGDLVKGTCSSAHSHALFHLMSNVRIVFQLGCKDKTSLWEAYSNASRKQDKNVTGIWVANRKPCGTRWSEYCFLAFSQT